MSSTLNADVALVVATYEKGIICSGEVVGMMIDFAAYSEVDQIMDLLP